MILTTRYIAATGFALIATISVVVFGLTLAGQAFPRPAATEGAATVAAAAAEDAAIDRPTSALLGSAKVADRSAQVDRREQPHSADKKWVEVVDAVNMRSGPSSSNAVIKVQLAGSQLQVSDRDGPWVQVVEPDTGTEGWVFENYVKRIAPASRRADSGTTRFQ